MAIHAKSTDLQSRVRCGRVGHSKGSAGREAQWCYPSRPNFKRSLASMSKRKQTEPPNEIQVTSSWGSLLENQTAALPRSKLQIGSHEVWLTDGVFSPAECATLVSRAEAHGFGTTNYDPSYRGNLRLTTTDTSLAAAVWKRLQPVAPPTLTLRKPASEVERGELWWAQYPNAEGVWEACGLNECWRLTKYRAGDRFLCHCDEAFVRSSTNEMDEMSMLTVNIYMNGDFEGGRTRFFFKDDWWEQLMALDGGTRYHLKAGKEADATVVPAAGRCLLFRQPPGQSYYHDGEEVASKCKYLFRSDVMYRKVASLP